jgi:hypothetical protein
MKRSDRELGMDRAITRRDFISGVGVAITGSALAGPWTALRSAQAESAAAAGASGLQEEAAYHPPAATGMRGSHRGSFEVAHALRDGARWDDLGPEAETGERYDLVVVGGGLSGLADAAIREARAAVQLYPLSRDAVNGEHLAHGLAIVYTLLDRREEAIDQLDLLLSVPGDVTRAQLRIDPLYDPLRDHPRFQALLGRLLPTESSKGRARGLDGPLTQLYFGTAECNSYADRRMSGDLPSVPKRSVTTSMERFKQLLRQREAEITHPYPDVALNLAILMVSYLCG